MSWFKKAKPEHDDDCKHNFDMWVFYPIVLMQIRMCKLCGFVQKRNV